jgi:hypothetical protein
MLFLFRLLTFPVTGPVRGFQFVLEQIRDQALAEMLSEDEIEALMIESSLRHQAGEISDEEYEEIETKLLEDLRTLRQLQRPDDFSVGYYEGPDEDEVVDSRQ